MNFHLNITKKHHVQRLKNYFNSLDKTKEYIVTIKEKKNIRTLDQNKYLWGVVYKVVANETGSDVDTMHDELKRMFGIKEEKASIITGEIFESLKSTKKYDTLELTNYINNIKNWVITFLGVTIPEPNTETAIYIYNNQYGA